MPSTFNSGEVSVLNQLKHTAGAEDYVLSWWDYGYPIRYYAQTNTLIDGGKHSGDVNWPVSFALTRPQLPSYNAAVLDVYLTEKDRKENIPFDFIKQVKKMYHLKSVYDVEGFLFNKIKLPEIKQNIYYYLPLRMLNIFPTVALFSYIDIKSGKINKKPFFVQTSVAGIKKQSLILRNGLILTADGKLGDRNGFIDLNTVVVTYYDKQNKLVVNSQSVNSKSNLVAIFMKSYNMVLILSKDLYNSAYIQMFVLERYNKDLFEPVIVTPFVKVYKVKK